MIAKIVSVINMNSVDPMVDPLWILGGSASNLVDPSAGGLRLTEGIWWLHLRPVSPFIILKGGRDKKLGRK